MAKQKKGDPPTPGPGAGKGPAGKKKDRKLEVDKVELDMDELDDVSGGWEKDYDNCFGIHLTPRKPGGTKEP